MILIYSIYCTIQSPVILIPASFILLRMFKLINRGVIFSTILAFSRGPHSMDLTPEIFSASSITISFAFASSPEIRQSHSTSSLMLVRLAALRLQNAYTTLVFTKKCC